MEHKWTKRFWMISMILLCIALQNGIFMQLWNLTAHPLLSLPALTFFRTLPATFFYWCCLRRPETVSEETRFQWALSGISEEAGVYGGKLIQLSVALLFLSACELLFF